MKQFLVALFLLSSTVFSVKAQNYTPADAGSKVSFSIKNFGINTTGTFTGLQGAVSFNPASATSGSFSVSVDANTVNTDNGSRDKHLRKSDYFDVARFPRISFVSTKITLSTKAGVYFAFGKLTIKGVTKEISFPFTAKAEGTGYRFDGNFTINRRDYGVGGKSLTMSDNLTVTLSVLTKK
jgi:polyisoprenoid-binding protein YceI